MATHYFPDGPGALHVGRRPRAAADRRRRRHRRLRDPRRQRQPDRPGLRRERDRGPRLGPRLPARRPGRTSRAPSPGDTLAVEILDLHTKGWGWTAILPGLGLLADDFTEPYLRIFDLTRGDVTPFREDIVIPLTPFMGTMGVCPAGATAQPVMPPGTFGGNMDTRQLVAGHDAVPAGPGRGRAVLHAATPTAARATARSASPASRRRCTPSLRFSAREGPLDPRAAVPHRARPADARASTTAPSTARPASAATCTPAPRTRRGR